MKTDDQKLRSVLGQTRPRAGRKKQQLSGGYEWDGWALFTFQLASFLSLVEPSTSGTLSFGRLSSKEIRCGSLPYSALNSSPPLLELQKSPPVPVWSSQIPICFFSGCLSQFWQLLPLEWVMPFRPPVSTATIQLDYSLTCRAWHIIYPSRTRCLRCVS